MKGKYVFAKGGKKQQHHIWRRDLGESIRYEAVPTKDGKHFSIRDRWKPRDFGILTEIDLANLGFEEDRNAFSKEDAEEIAGWLNKPIIDLNTEPIKIGKKKRAYREGETRAV